MATMQQGDIKYTISMVYRVSINLGEIFESLVFYEELIY